MASRSQAPVLMVQGTASHAGKSLLVAGLCRLFAEDGQRVAPFKAQNMSNNAGVTPEGGEIGRAQVAQAEAAGVEPTVHMNPVLLKPEGERTSQVVVRGRERSRASADRYMQTRVRLWDEVAESLDRLRSEYDLVVAEGAGSPAEINLRDRDIVNMRVARYADAAVLLVGDIERGGVFASLYGTLALLAPEDRDLVKGLVINKFRGDRAVLEPGLEELTDRTGVPVLGVVPYLDDLRVPEEDSLALDERSDDVGVGETSLPSSVMVSVVRAPRISNFDEFAPLESEPDISVRYVTSPDALRETDLLVLPGSKATARDLAWLRGNGLAAEIRSAAERGVPVIGICGGYQMMGEWIRDPHGVESGEESVRGLGLLPVETVLRTAKETHRARGEVETAVGLLRYAEGCRFTGYEIHMGHTAGVGEAAFRVKTRSGRPVDEPDGVLAGSGGHLLGTYLHGVFRSPAIRRSVVDYARLRSARGDGTRNGEPGDGAREPRSRPSEWNVADSGPDPYGRVAGELRKSLDLRRVRALVER